MFNFRKKSKKEKLEIKYKKLLEEAYILSHTNRKESDRKKAMAEALLEKIQSLDN